MQYLINNFNNSIFNFIYNIIISHLYTDPCSSKPSKTNINPSKTFKLHGSIINVSDEIVYCIGLSKIKFGEIVYITINNLKYKGLVVNIS